ncbi:MAG: Rho termination factor N-terminal domain-containing protein [Solirubrobacterales bacterium]
MAVLERYELEASPLADLHAIADQLGLDGFRRLRKPELIDAILGEGKADQDGECLSVADRDEESGAGDADRAPLARGRRRGGRSATGRSRRSSTTRQAAGAPAAEEGEQEEPANGAPRDAGAIAEGIVELLGNGSAFLRVSPPDPSDDDVYISAAQVRRCELVSGDRVSGPVRTPRRSERYPSLVRIDTINGASADTVADGARYEDLPVAYPSERIALGSQDPTLEAIEWLTPLGLGSRALIVGAARSGKTETLRSLLAAVHGREGVEVTLVLAGSRPEEIAQWQDGLLAPVAALSFAASADSQGQAVERAVDAAKRVAARGGDALVLIDSLDGLHPPAVRKALAAARNLRDAGSLTVIATATRPFGGETTVIALDVALTSTGRQPILDLLGSGTLKAELLVGEDGAQAITQARATALEAAG